jgi:hypothetical protein
LVLARAWIGQFLFHLHSNIPMFSVSGYGHVLGRSLYLAALVEPKPSELGQVDVPVLNPKALGEPERVVNEFLFEPGISGVVPFGVVPGPDFLQFAEEPLVGPVKVNQTLLQDLGVGLLQDLFQTKRQHPANWANFCSSPARSLSRNLYPLRIIMFSIILLVYEYVKQIKNWKTLCVQSPCPFGLCNKVPI